MALSVSVAATGEHNMLIFSPSNPKHSSFQYLAWCILLLTIFSTRFCGSVPCMLRAPGWVLFAMTLTRATKTIHCCNLEDLAFSLQTRLITERCVSPDDLASAGQWMQPEHFTGVTQERSLMGICGWPLCPKDLPKERRPKYRYYLCWWHLTCRWGTGVLHDDTALLEYCCESCYRESVFFLRQLSHESVQFRTPNLAKKPVFLSPPSSLPHSLPSADQQQVLQMVQERCLDVESRPEQPRGDNAHPLIVQQPNPHQTKTAALPVLDIQIREKNTEAGKDGTTDFTLSHFQQIEGYQYGKYQPQTEKSVRSKTMAHGVEGTNDLYQSNNN